MTNEETIEVLDDMKIKIAIPKSAITQRKRNEALDMAIKALEKDIAKEPVQTHKRYGHGNEYDDYYCPECDEFLAYEPKGNRYKFEGDWSRCRNCGQKIIWRDETE